MGNARVSTRCSRGPPPGLAAGHPEQPACPSPLWGARSIPTAYLGVKVLEDVLQDVCFDPGQHQLLGSVNSHKAVAQDQGALYFLHFVVAAVLSQQMSELIAGGPRAGSWGLCPSAEGTRGSQGPPLLGFLLPMLLVVAVPPRAPLEHQVCARAVLTARRCPRHEAPFAIQH